MASNLRVDQILPSTSTNVAIGTATGSVTLVGSVSGTSITNSGVTTVAAGSASAPSITPTGDSNTGIFFPSPDTIAFAEGGVEALRIDSSANIGIGTNSPGAGIKLDVVGGEIKAGRVDSSQEGGQVSFGRATDNATGWYIDVYGNTSTPSLRFVDVSNSAVRATIDGSGRMTLPYQPAFQAYGDGSYTTYSVNVEITKFTFTTYNIGSHYNTTTCRFTAPVAGVYLFTATFLTETDQSGSLTFAINGNDATAQARMYMSAERGRSNSILLQLAVNDYVSLFARDNNLRIYGVSYSGFSGVLLG
jgi:hypothetical protein